MEPKFTFHAVPAMTPEEIKAFEATHPAEVSLGTALAAIGLALKHINEGVMATSAQLCYDDACTCMMRSDYEHARTRALKSLAYSVGVFHEDYKKAAHAV